MSNILTNEQKMAKDNCIAKFLVGSLLYGTNTPKSDKDYVGIFIEDPEYVIGTKRVDEVDFSTNKTNKRNNNKDIDTKFYTLRKFISLAKNNNPNILELFFVPKQNLLVTSPYWKIIENNKKYFISRKTKHSFTGYAMSQKKKLLIKKRRLETLREFNELIDKSIKNGATKVGEITLDSSSEFIKILEDPFTKKENKIGGIKVDDKEYNWGMDIKKIKNYVEYEINRYGGRTKYLDDYGYDIKFASHLFRLLYEGLEILKDGQITLPRPERKFLLDIRNGNYSLEELLRKVDELEPLFEMVYLKTELPKCPDDKGISKLQMQLYFQYWKDYGRC